MRILDPQLRRSLAERVHFYRELGIHDFYRRPEGLADLQDSTLDQSAIATLQPELRESMYKGNTAISTAVAVIEDDMFDVLNPKPEYGTADPIAAL